MTGMANFDFSTISNPIAQPDVGSYNLSAIGKQATSSNAPRIGTAHMGSNGMPEIKTDSWASNLKTAGTAVDTLSGLARIFLGFKQSKLLAKDLKFQRQAHEQNLAGSRAAFNMAVEDRARSRGATEGNQAAAAEYQARYTLPYKKI